MQLFPLALSITALLAHGASGYYLLEGIERELRGYGPAALGPGDGTGPVRFYESGSKPTGYSRFHLDDQGDLGSGGHVLQKVAEDKYILVYTGAHVAPSATGNITQPFGVSVDGQFLYDGEGGGEWNLCTTTGGREWDIYLSTTTMRTDENCVWDAILVATEYPDGP